MNCPNSRIHPPLLGDLTLFNLENALAVWRKKMTSAGIKRPEFLDELESHLLDTLEDLIRKGVSEELAFSQAAQQLGKEESLRIEFKKLAAMERQKWMRCGLLSGLGVFLFIAALSYVVLLPLVLAANAAYAQWLGFSPVGFQPEVYARFAVRFILGMALAFEIPVLILTLVKMKVVTPEFLRNKRKFVIILNLVLGVMTTTPAIVPHLSLFLLLQMLFEASVWLGRFWEPGYRGDEGAVEPD